MTRSASANTPAPLRRYLAWCVTVLVLLCLSVGAVHSVMQTRQLKKPPPGASLTHRIAFYMKRLGDSSYVGTYGDGENVSTWYQAAEELGMIGAPALAPLVERVVTTTRVRATNWFVRAAARLTGFPDQARNSDRLPAAPALWCLSTKT
jgi:hypothetical protein